MFTYNDEEEVLSQSEENGSIIINTRENTDEGIDEYTYTVDAETKEITHVYKITKDAEGNVLWSSDQEIGFNTDVYELPEEITAAMTSTDTRTVTLTTDPGTEDEKVYSKEVAKNIYANIELAEGYDSLYDDEACTVEHESVGLNEYINVYAAKGK
ncbi:MAG: hypothetical protein LUG66_06015 [Clostridiales bacterium]|nr:hypothetical protein [Clostridiales bacterium]